jgi:glycosyltransferase involved in cell wall biosynthesis
LSHGNYPTAYLHDPNISKPLEEIYADIDAYTYEVLRGDTELYDSLDFIVTLPPVQLEGRFVKGMFYSHGVDQLHACFPVLRQLFTSLAYSMWSSYPWAELADASLVCYQNLQREAWYRRRHPHRSGLPLLPLQDADFTHEYRFAPVPVRRKDIDLLCVSRLSELKNLPLIASALKIYRQKYPLEPIRMTLITGNKWGYAPEQLGKHAAEELQRIERVLERSADYIDFVPHANHWKEMPHYYSRARALVLGSLIEGKNRSINEALCCNLPVICFEEHNQFARQGFPVFPERAGVYAAYDAEALADAIHLVLSNGEEFSPRLSYLGRGGRRGFLNQCIDAIPYYRDALPDHTPSRHTENRWLDVAVHQNYGVSLHDFLYNNTLGIAYLSGLQGIGRAIEAYQERFEC